MKKHSIKFLPMIMLILFLMLSTIGNAQRATPRDVVIETNRQEMDTLLLRKPIVGASDVSVRMSILKQLNEDFRGLQVANNKLKELTVSKLLDYKKITNLITEIGSRASRLKANLALPEIEPKKEKPVRLEITQADQLQTELSKLDEVIVSFAHNPVFQKVNVVDIQLAHRASGELTTIIDQSRELKKAATKLEKASRK